MSLFSTTNDYLVYFWNRSLDGGIRGRMILSPEKRLAEEGTVSDELFIDLLEMRVWDCDLTGRTIYYPLKNRTNIRVSLDGKIYGVMVMPLDRE